MPQKHCLLLKTSPSSFSSSMAVNTVKWLLRVAPHYLLEVLSSCCRKYNTNISPALAIQTARTSCQHRVEYLRLFTPTFTFHAPAPPASPPTSTDNERQRGSSGSSIAIDSGSTAWSALNKTRLPDGGVIIHKLHLFPIQAAQHAEQPHQSPLRVEWRRAV